MEIAMNDPAKLSIVRSNEEMLEYIHDLNRKIVQNMDVSDAEIIIAITYQRDLNQHNMEKKASTRKSKTSKEPVKKISLEDL